MPETLPTEAPYTLRDISAYLINRVRNANRLPPLPARMDFETAIALKLFHRLERASKKWYLSELDPDKFAMIVVRVLEGSGRTYAQVWGMSVESFDSWWLERIQMKKGKRIGLPSDFPSSVLEWLTSKYLSNPTPDSILHPAFADKCVVYEKMDTFTDFLQANAIPIASTLEALSTAYLIADMRFDLYGDEPSTEGLPLVSSIARMRLPPGSYRMLAISVDVLEASKTQQTIDPKGKSGKSDPSKPKGKGGKRPLIQTNPLLVSLYDSVLVEWREGRPSNEIIIALQAKRDVVELAKGQMKELDAQLIRKAKKYRNENPKI